MINAYHHECKNMSQTSLNFYLHNQVFACWHRLDRIFSSRRFYFSTSHGLATFFLVEVLFHCKPTWFSNVGASLAMDTTGLKQVTGTRNRTQDPKIMLHGLGFKPWTYKNIMHMTRTKNTWIAHRSCIKIRRACTDCARKIYQISHVKHIFLHHIMYQACVDIHTPPQHPVGHM